MPRVLNAVVLLAAVTLPIAMLGQTGSCPAGMEMFRQHRWFEAEAAFAACEDHDPGKTDALLYRGKSLVNLRRYDDAAVSLRLYATAHPQSDDAAYLLAYVSFRQDKPQESLKLFTEASKLKSPIASDLKIVALDYVLLKDYSDAAHYLELSLKMDPGDTEARYHLGRVRYQQNQFDLAIAAFGEVLQHDPGNVKAQDNLGLSLEAKNQIEPAIAAYEKAIALDKAATSHTEQPYLNLGSLLAKANRFDEAIPLLSRACEIAPNEFNAHYQLAKAHFDSNHLETARLEGEVAVRLSPTDSSGHYLLGRIYQRLGRTEPAKEQFRLTSEIIRNKDAKSQNGMASGMNSH
jgi:tetratricopeptide (TPR) repeat protein